VVECGGVWWSVVECGGEWWSVVECGGVGWSVVECVINSLLFLLINSYIKRVRVSEEGEVINIHT
jgi:hypothetical protein